MWDGEPQDAEGECNARLYIGDDYGDNHATMRCQLAPGHPPPHRETCRRFTVTWEVDEREERRRSERELEEEERAEEEKADALDAVQTKLEE